MGLDISTMTTEFAAPVSRTQMNFSDSIVRLVKLMHAGLMPAAVSCTHEARERSGGVRWARGSTRQPKGWTGTI